MTTEAAKPKDSWFRSRNLSRLSFAVVAAAPIAGGIVAVLVAYTLYPNVIFLIEDPNNDSTYVSAGLMGIAANTAVTLISGVLMGGIFGWPVMVVFGLPIHAVLLRMTPAWAWIYGLAGGIAGIIPGAMNVVTQNGIALNDLATPTIAIGIGTGAIAALVFWLLRRPDRDAASFKS